MALATVDLVTPKESARAGPEGSREPGSSSPVRMAARMDAAIWTLGRRGSAVSMICIPQYGTCLGRYAIAEVLIDRLRRQAYHRRMSQAEHAIIAACIAELRAEIRDLMARAEAIAAAQDLRRAHVAA